MWRQERLSVDVLCASVRRAGPHETCMHEAGRLCFNAGCSLLANDWMLVKPAEGWRCGGCVSLAVLSSLSMHSLAETPSQLYRSGAMAEPTSLLDGGRDGGSDSSKRLLFSSTV